MTHARDGYLFYRVVTPQVAVEYELPKDVDRYSDSDAARWEELQDTAERHGCAVEANPYSTL
jgi:hypothetical protein